MKKESETTNEIYIFNQIWVGSYNVIGVGDSREKAVNEAWKAYKKSFGSDTSFHDKDKWLDYHGIYLESIKPIKVNSGWVE